MAPAALRVDKVVVDSGLAATVPVASVLAARAPVARVPAAALAVMTVVRVVILNRPHRCRR